MISILFIPILKGSKVYQALGLVCREGNKNLWLVATQCGNSHIFECSPRKLGKIPILTVAYVQKGLKLNHQFNLYFCFPIFSPSFQCPPVFRDRRRLLPFRTPPLWTSDASNDASHEGGIGAWKTTGRGLWFSRVFAT